MSRTGRAAQTTASEPSSATFVAHSVCIGAISSVASSPIATAYRSRGCRPAGAVFGSVIM